MVTGEGRGQKNNREERGEERALQCRNGGRKKLLFPKLWRVPYLFISDPTLNLKQKQLSMCYQGYWSGYVIKMNAGKTCGEEKNSHTSSALWVWNTEFPQLSPHISIVLPTCLNPTTTTTANLLCPCGRVSSL